MENFTIKFPHTDRCGESQPEEYCTVVLKGRECKIRFHDYHEIYAIPGLYERLFIEKLGCKSPEVMTSLLLNEVSKSSASTSDLTVLDLGAGNGLVGEKLKQQGVRSIVGVDIIFDAAEATRRDRPGVYDAYYVGDLRRLSADALNRLRATNFNCLITVGALGFGDIQPLAFAQAFNLVIDNGWIAFNIKDEFLDAEDSTGFSNLINEMIDIGILKVKVMYRYRHRFSVDGVPLYYIAVVGKKVAPIPLNVFRTE
jgi:SAM-dependent methyltransferase